MYNNLLGYGKKSFNLLFNNPVLFVPTVIQLVVMITYILMLTSMMRIGRNVGAGLFSVFLVVIIGIFIDAGAKYMIKRTMESGSTNMSDFIDGAKKYFLRLAGGGVLIVLVFAAVGVVLTPILLIFGAFGAFLLMILLLIVGVLISMWTTILVYEDCSVFEAFSYSFRFAKKNFGLLVVVNILQIIFTGDSNGVKWNDDSQGALNQVSIPLLFRPLVYMSFVFVIFGVIIGTILKVFFQILLFAIYDDRRMRMN